MLLHAPRLCDDEIHVWHLPWPGTGPAAARPAPTLPGAASDAVLNVFETLVRAYAPDAPAIRRAEHGKPVLPPPHDTLGFSWSHARDAALFAIGRGVAGFQLGVDVEHVRSRPRQLEIARRYFAPAEVDALAALDEADRTHAFFSLWTAKEAVLKAHGGGLSYGLHKVSFSLGAGSPAAASFDGDIAPAGAWQIHALEVGPAHIAALAWRGGPRTVRVFTSSL